MTDLTQQLKDSIAYEEEKRERKRMRQIALEVEFEKKRREAIDRGQVYSGAPLLYRGYRIYTGDYTKWQFEHNELNNCSSSNIKSSRNDNRRTVKTAGT